MDIPGYVFIGCSQNADRTGNRHQKADIAALADADDIIYYTCYKESDNVAYNVEYYLEQTNGSYKLKDLDKFTGTTRATVNVRVSQYPNYTFGKNVSGAVLADGALVLKLYYRKDSSSIISKPSTSIGTKGNRSIIDHCR